jgi:predicted nuclease with TOPRIM domain
MSPFRAVAVSLLLVFVATLSAFPSMAHGHPSADHRFAWAVVSAGGESHWEIQDSDRIDELKARITGDFLYARDETGRYLITDPELVEEAREALREMEKHHDTIRALAEAESRLGMARFDHGDHVERLRKRLKAVDEEIEQRERAGASTRDLERRKLELTAERDAILGIMERSRLGKEEEQALVRQRDAASKRLREVERTIENKVRAIVESAKKRGLAERLER